MFDYAISGFGAWYNIMHIWIILVSLDCCVGPVAFLWFYNEFAVCTPDVLALSQGRGSVIAMSVLNFWLFSLVCCVVEHSS